MTDLIRQIAHLNVLKRRGAFSQAQWYAAVARAIREHAGVEQ